MKIVVFIFALFISSSLHAQELYRFKIIEIIDGDTIRIDAPFLPKELKQTLLLRIYGVNTPEKGFRAKCSRENLMALNAKSYVEQEIKNGKDIFVILYKWDKYGGRVLGDLIIDGVPLNQKLIESNYATPYYGKGKKKNWCY